MVNRENCHQVFVSNVKSTSMTIKIYYELTHEKSEEKLLDVISNKTLSFVNATGFERHEK